MSMTTSTLKEIFFYYYFFFYQWIEEEKKIEIKKKKNKMQILDTYRMLSVFRFGRIISSTERSKLPTMTKLNVFCNF